LLVLCCIRLILNDFSTVFSGSSRAGRCKPHRLKRAGVAAGGSAAPSPYPKTALESHSAAQARAWADGDFGADHGFAPDGVGRPAH
jgi:hypothetical protein